MIELNVELEVSGMTQYPTDRSLSIRDMPADAKSTGDAIGEIREKINTDVVTKSEDLIDDLATDDPTKALSAAQGYALNSKIKRVSEQIGDNNYGITVNHYYNGCAHTLVVTGQITQELPMQTRWDIAPSASLAYFINYVPAYDYDNDAYGYFYTVNGRLCFQTNKTVAAGRNIRFILNWV